MRWLGDAKARADEQGRLVRARREAGEPLGGTPTTEPARPRGHPKGRFIGLIWGGVFVLAFIGAAVFQDNDPATDDGAGWGALAGIAGLIITLVYVVGSSVLSGRRDRRERDSR